MTTAFTTQAVEYYLDRLIHSWISDLLNVERATSATDGNKDSIAKKIMIIRQTLNSVSVK